MKRLLICLVMFLASPSVLAEFKDPMRPPEYALNKLRAERLKEMNINKPIQAVVKKDPTWVLSSILYSKDRKHAIINNKLVRKGDLINGARVVRLQPDSVQLVAKGKTIELNLRSRYKSIKKSPHKRKL
jgi:hypothetical protein